MNLSGDPHVPVHSHRLLIRRCEVLTWIGVYEHEQAQPTRLLFDLDIDVDARLAAATDRIGDAVDYGAIVADLRECLAQERNYLLETLSEFVADRILSRFNAGRVRLSVCKIGILDGVGSVGVEIERFQRPGKRTLLSVPSRAHVALGASQ